MSISVEQKTEAIEVPNSIVQRLSERTLWVCFLNPEGYESFAKGSYIDGKIVVSGSAELPKEREVSTIQFWQGEQQVTVLPTGQTEDGTPLFQTVEMLLEQGELPDFTARSLAKRIQRQPHRASPDVAIYPLLQLPPFVETS